MTWDAEEGEDNQEQGDSGRRPGIRIGARLGRRVLDKHMIVTDANDVTYIYDGRFWAELKPRELRRLVLEAEDDQASSTIHRSREAVEWIKSASCDLTLEWGRVAAHEIACENGVLDVLTGELRPHRADDYLERVLPWSWEPGQPVAVLECPTWAECLLTWFGDDDLGAELIDALQEFFGYVLLPHARLKKALLLYGPSNTGKSLVVHVLRKLVGDRFTCSIGVDRMDDPRALPAIVGKALNIMTELSAEAMVKDGGFKTLVSTEEAVSVEPKYKDSFLYIPSAKHVIATNKLPRITDRTDATYNRLLLIPMRNVIRAPDPTLYLQLEAEIHGILKWAADGARRLVQRGGEWPTPHLSTVALEKYKAEQNPIVLFVKERLELDTEGHGWRMPLADITDAFNEWQRGGRSASVRQVGAWLRDAGFLVKVMRFADGRHGAGVAGLRLRPDLAGRAV